MERRSLTADAPCGAQPAVAGSTTLSMRAAFRDAEVAMGCVNFAHTRFREFPWNSTIASPAIAFVRHVRSNEDARLRAFSRHTRAGRGPFSVSVPKITDLLLPGVGSIVAAKVAKTGLDVPCRRRNARSTRQEINHRPPSGHWVAGSMGVGRHRRSRAAARL